MKVRDRLSLQFNMMFAILLTIVLLGIYFFVDHNRLITFNEKLDNRALTVAQFYLAEDNLSKETFDDVLKKFPQSLSDESIRIYNDNFQPQFIDEGSIRWPKATLLQITKQGSIHLIQNKIQTAGLYYKDNSGNFIIIVSAPDESGYQEMYKLRLIMMFFFLFSLIITFLTGKLFSKLALSPIVRITDDLKVISSSSLNQRLTADPKKTDEIDMLCIAINQLLEHLEQSFGSQKSFIAHASHELRTPITMILGEAEITLMKDRTKAQYQLALANIAEEASRLGSIINSLMDLVQTNLENIGFQDLRMDELLWQILDELENQPGATKVRAMYDLPIEISRYTIQGNRQLLFIAISNIIKNAMKFSGGKEVSCKMFCDEKGVHIMISDKGIGIETADIDKIFQPFFRSTNALGFTGNGIGLSLSHNIIKGHSGTIHVSSSLGQGSVFGVFLPAYQD